METGPEQDLVAESPPKRATPEETLKAAQAALAMRDYRRFTTYLTPEAQELLAGDNVLGGKLMMMVAPKNP